jgi:hypothetical protein
VLHPRYQEGSERAVRDEWRFNYLGMFLSVTGIILVIACVMLAYDYLDYAESKLDGEAVAGTTLPVVTVTIVPSTTSTTTTTTTTLAPSFEDRNRQDFLERIPELLAETRLKLIVFDSALEAEDDDTITRMAGELAVLWNSAPPRAPQDVEYAVEYNAARSRVGNTFLALYDAMNKHDRSDKADAKVDVQIEALPLIEALEQAIGP